MGNVYTGAYMGFTEQDDGIISLLSIFLSLKLYQIKVYILLEEKDRHFNKLLDTLNSLLRTRSYMSLMMELREVMPQLLGYEHFGVYYHDTKSIFHF